MENELFFTLKNHYEVTESTMIVDKWKVSLAEIRTTTLGWIM